MIVRRQSPLTISEVQRNAVTSRATSDFPARLWNRCWVLLASPSHAIETKLKNDLVMRLERVYCNHLVSNMRSEVSCAYFGVITRERGIRLGTFASWGLGFFSSWSLVEASCPYLVPPSLFYECRYISLSALKSGMKKRPVNW